MQIAITAGTSGPGKTQYFINQAYINYLKDSGYSPLLLVPGSDIEFAANNTAGLLLPGGIDIDPIFYGEDNIGSFSVDPERDDFERQVFYAFGNIGKPIFGICRGFQLIAREFMRTFQEESKYLDFYQHVSNHNPTNDYSLARTYPSHSVNAFTQELYENGKHGFNRIFVNSMHHQGLIVAPQDKKDKFSLNHGFLQIMAYTNFGIGTKIKGALVEAFKINNWFDNKILAVQWHPEELKDVNLLRSFFGGNNVNHNGVHQNH